MAARKRTRFGGQHSRDARSQRVPRPSPALARRLEEKKRAPEAATPDSALLYMARSITSMYLLSPVARNIRWLSVMNISAAHVSAYAEMFGSEYGSPKPSLPVEPPPPV